MKFTFIFLAASVGVAHAGPFELEAEGWGEVQLAWLDHGPDQTRAGGSQKDSRLVFDTTRFVIELEGELERHGVEFAAEVEIEHGGTGSALELEYEEFGEFEREVEQGGEVVLEELWVEKELGERFRLRAGRFYVAIGEVFDHGGPLDYMATIRSEAETVVLPVRWHEIGLQATASLGRAFVTLQVVNGLDSTGFSSQRWVASGHQTRFEEVRATDLAVVGRVDVTVADGIVVGGGAYYGGTTRNRPKPDLVETCADMSTDEVAPCGYIDAPLFIGDLHGSLTRGPVRATFAAIWGHLWNADDITARNDRLSNELGVFRTPVAEEALAIWGEVGVDVAPWLCLGADHRLEAFARVDHYDTMFAVGASTFDNPRFERTVVTGGASYALAQAWFTKLDASYRRLGSSDFRPETTIRLSTGFVY